MLRYLAIRTAQSVVALIAVVTAVFALSRLSGNTAQLMAPPQASPEQIAALEKALGLNHSFFVQYKDYLWNLLQGNLGTSSSYSAPVSHLIREALPNTVELAFAAFVFAVVLGVPLGLWAGMRRGGTGDGAIRAGSIVGQSVPSFALGIVLVFLFSVKIHIFPAYGTGSFKHLILPAVTLGAFALAAITRLTRSAVIEVTTKDQTLFERIKGVHPAVVTSHVLRNASLPVITLLGITLGALVSGTVIVETLFAWPGLGRLAIQAINARDYTLIQGIVIVDVVIFLVLLLLVDLSYTWIDPRVRKLGTNQEART
jgi:peptide/nickel transport system permease protein